MPPAVQRKWWATNKEIIFEYIVFRMSFRVQYLFDSPYLRYSVLRAIKMVHFEVKKKVYRIKVKLPRWKLNWNWFLNHLPFFTFLVMLFMIINIQIPLAYSAVRQTKKKREYTESKKVLRYYWLFMVFYSF